MRTLNCLNSWKGNAIVELSKLKIEIDSIDFLDLSGNIRPESPFQFQQPCFRLWYQFDGNGVLQNVTRKNFASARPGMLGIMDRGERHAYLHQRGTFRCFQILFSFLPSQTAKCYWNTEIEGKTVLEGNE
ncbi:MAG: hypothetical protein Q4F84_08410, partial [Fibrobacter sp.]|nr:hypothetical protein [Fibrobacter sp.]